MKHICFISLTACLQLALIFSATSHASSAQSPAVSTTSGKLVGFNDGAGGTLLINTVEVR
jgi:hypothetical protein